MPRKTKTKEYVPIPVIVTDQRSFYLRCETRVETKQMLFTQLDFLQIRNYLRGKNDRLFGKLTRFIQAIDRDNGELTDFARKLPRRRGDE